MKRLITAIASAAILALALTSMANATKPSPDHKVAICHRTASDTNPYVYIEVDVAAVKAHLDNGHGHPAKKWKSGVNYRGVAYHEGDAKDDYLANSKEDCTFFPTSSKSASPSGSATPTPVGTTPSVKPSVNPSEKPVPDTAMNGPQWYVVGNGSADLTWMLWFFVVAMLATALYHFKKN